MIRINLLPFRAARKKENVRRQVSIFLLSLMLIAVGTIYTYMSLNRKIDDLNNQVAQTEKELKKYNKINKQIEKIRKDLKILEKKTEVIQTLEASREESVRFLDAMTEMVIGKRMWLTNLTVKGNSISTKGVALDNRTIADFMTRLERSGKFKNVRLKTSIQKKQKNVDLKNFDITFNRIPLNSQSTEKSKS